MDFKAIIFDMDGTITDTEPIWTRANQELLKQKGVYTPELMARIQPLLHGMASVTCCTIIKEHAGLTESVEALVEQKSAIARALYLEGISFVKGFADFHDVVKNHGLKSAIATNALDDTLHLTEQALRLSRFFGEHRYGISRVNYVSKPAPDIYLHAAEKLQVAPRHCIAIEDSPAGIKAAKAAGMYCIGINTGRRRHALAEADCIVERYEDIQLSGILKKQP